MNIIALLFYILFKAPPLLFKYIHKDNQKIGKRLTILEYICRIADILSLGLMLFYAYFASNTLLYIWFGICMILLVIYYYIYLKYFQTQNLRILYGISKINLPTVLLEIAFVVITGILTFHPLLIASSFIYGVIHYHLETEVQKRIRFR